MRHLLLAAGLAIVITPIALIAALTGDPTVGAAPTGEDATPEAAAPASGPQISYRRYRLQGKPTAADRILAVRLHATGVVGVVWRTPDGRRVLRQGENTRAGVRLPSHQDHAATLPAVLLPYRIQQVNRTWTHMHLVHEGRTVRLGHHFWRDVVREA